MTTQYTPTWSDDDGVLMLDSACVATFLDIDDFPCVDDDDRPRVIDAIAATRHQIVAKLNCHESLVAALQSARFHVLSAYSAGSPRALGDLERIDQALAQVAPQ